MAFSVKVRAVAELGSNAATVRRSERGSSGGRGRLETWFPQTEIKCQSTLAV